ncbi:unnamed protein product, partial [Discosporangium mesarthrocarpum]
MASAVLRIRDRRSISPTSPGASRFPTVSTGAPSSSLSRVSSRFSTSATISSSSSSSSSASSLRWSGNGGGVWASLLSLGSALPQALLPYQCDSDAITAERSIHETAVLPGGEAGAGRGQEDFEESLERAGQGVVITGGASAETMRLMIEQSILGGAETNTERRHSEKVHLTHGDIITCSFCRTHLATRDHIISELFHGHGGRAFLFEHCVNVKIGKLEDRRLLTGLHVVADISCCCCNTVLGWRY